MTGWLAAVGLGVGLGVVASPGPLPPVPFEDQDSGRWGFREVGGKVVIPAAYGWAGPFNDRGVAMVADEQGLACVDRKGRVLLRPLSVDNGPDAPVEGLARFTAAGKVGFFDPACRVVIPARYDFALPFQDGVARVCQGRCLQPQGEHMAITDGEWSMVDRKGQRVTPATREPVQSPPPGLGTLMQAMEEDGHRVVAEARAGTGPGEARFRRGALHLFAVMWPAFGPANAALFAARSRVLRALAEATGQGANAVEGLDAALLERAGTEAAALAEALRGRGLRVALSSSDRGVLLWTGAEALRLVVEDPNHPVPWTPPYANTPAGPLLQPRLRPRTLTLLLTLPRDGVAHVNSVARERPGDAWFFTGTLTGFTLQEPQSHDVEPDALRVVVEEVLQTGRLVRHVPTTTLERARSALAASTVTAQGGILWAHGGEVPGRERLTGLVGEAIHWSSGGGVEVERRLVYP